MSSVTSTAIYSPSNVPHPSDLVGTWAFLEEGVDHIMTKLQTGVSYSKVIATSCRRHTRC